MNNSPTSVHERPNTRETGEYRDQRARRVNNIQNPRKSAKPPSPVQIRAAPPIQNLENLVVVLLGSAALRVGECAFWREDGHAWDWINRIVYLPKLAYSFDSLRRRTRRPVQINGQDTVVRLRPLSTRIDEPTITIPTLTKPTVTKASCQA